MSGGTSLHLAILRKLSSSEPNKNFIVSFSNYQRRINVLPVIQVPEPQVASFQMKPKNRSSQARTRNFSKKHKKRSCSLVDEENICQDQLKGWQIQNEQTQIDYSRQIKKYSLLGQELNSFRQQHSKKKKVFAQYEKNLPQLRSIKSSCLQEKPQKKQAPQMHSLYKVRQCMKRRRDGRQQRCLGKENSLNETQSLFFKTPFVKIPSKAIQNEKKDRFPLTILEECFTMRSVSTARND